MLKAFKTIIWRDLLLYARRQGEWSNPLLFFVVVVSLFPLALGSYLNSLAIITPAVIWVAVVLALLMSLENLFRLDYQEGALEQLLLSPYPLSGLLLGKMIAHWIAIGMPLLMLAPLLKVVLQGHAKGWSALCLSLLLGIPTLSLIGSIGAALTIGLQQSGLLLTVLVLPLMLPIVIFAASSVMAASQGLPFGAELLWLGALLVLALGLAPVALGAAIKISLHDD